MNGKKRVIYGLGKAYKEVQSQLDSLPGELYYCDRDEAKVCGREHGLTLPYLQEHLSDYDEIIITFGEILKVGDAMQSIGACPKQYRLRTQVLEENEPTTIHYHGEEGIDAVVELALQGIGMQPGGIRYIEIGTNDPINGNNSYRFYQLGARGILVDPLLQSEIAAMAVRPGDCFRRAAVVAERQAPEVEFYVNTDIASGISSIYADHYKTWGGNAPQKIKVPAVAIGELLDEAGFVPDVLFIDAEGEDENLLHALPLGRYPIPLICVEVCNLSFERYRDVVEYMRNQGYSLYMTTPRRVNSIFLRDDTKIRE